MKQKSKPNFQFEYAYFRVKEYTNYIILKLQILFLLPE
jgi:hypothetical protein